MGSWFGGCLSLVIYTVLCLWQLFTGIHICLVACHQHPIRLHQLSFKFLVSNQHFILSRICTLPYSQLPPNRTNKTAICLANFYWVSVMNSIFLSSRVYRIKHHGHNCHSQGHMTSWFRLTASLDLLPPFYLDHSLWQDFQE